MQRLINIQAGDFINRDKEEEDALQNDFFYDWRHIEKDKKIVSVLRRLKEMKMNQDSGNLR